MLGKNTAVFGIYPTYESLEGAVDALRSSGFRNTDVSFLMAENVGSKDLGHRKASKGARGRRGWSQFRSGSRRRVGLAHRNRRPHNSGFRGLSGCRPCGCGAGGCRCCGNCGRTHRWPYRNRHSGIRSQEISGTRAKRRESVVRPLRRSGVDETRERDSRTARVRRTSLQPKRPSRLRAHRQTDPADRRHR